MLARGLEHSQPTKPLAWPWYSSASWKRLHSGWMSCSATAGLRRAPDIPCHTMPALISRREPRGHESPQVNAMRECVQRLGRLVSNQQGSRALTLARARPKRPPSTVPN